MKTTAQEYKAIVVAETDQLQELACTAVQELGKKLRNERSVDALVKRFAKTIASDPSSLRVEILNVVGFCNTRKDQPGFIEPIVIYEGKPVALGMAHIMEAGEYWVASADELAES